MRGLAEKFKAFTRSKIETGHSIIRAMANSISAVVNANVGSTGVAGHKPCQRKLSETL